MAGKRGKTAQNKTKQEPKLGEKVMLINMSGKDQFCSFTGRKLPRKGMVVRHDGRYYADFEAVRRSMEN